MIDARLLLSLSAWKGSGKDTVADHLVSEYNFKKISFAAKLKDMVASTYNVPREFMDLPSQKEQPLLNLPAIPSDGFTETIHQMLRAELSSGFWTPRALCILEGSIKRAVHSNYWVKEAIREIGSNPTQNFVITDMRYKTEADTINMFYPENKVIRIHRFDSSPTTDPSERDMDDYRPYWTLKNTETKEDLYDQVDYFINNLPFE